MADNLLTFKWTGINKRGKRLNGNIQAIDLKAAENELLSREVEIITIKQLANTKLLTRSGKIKPKDILLFTRYLTTMITAGLPIIQGLDIISKDPGNDLMRSVVISIKNNVSSGMTLADSLAQYPKYFDELYINLVRAGEKSGTLEKVLVRLVKYLERIQMLKKKVRNALIYPVAIILVALLVSLVLLIFVIPQFETIFQNSGTQLPAFTRGVVAVSQFLRHDWWIIILVLGGGFFLFRYQNRTNERFAKWVDATKLRLFVIGNILKKAIIARFTRTLAITLDSGLPIVESMSSMINIMGNRIYAQALRDICEKISSGHQLSTAMSNTKLFPNMTIQMINIGEASGSLTDMLNVVANYYEEEVNQIADNLSTLIEPVIIVILGFIIGCFVIAMYLPIFKIGSAVQG